MALLIILNSITTAFLVWLLELTPMVLSCSYTNQIFTSSLELLSDNCVIDSCLFINTTGNAIIIQENLTNITITNCQFSNITGYGIIFTNNQIENILIKNNTFKSLNKTAIFCESPIINLIIKYNHISNIPNYAIQINSFITDVSITHNKIHQVHGGIYMQSSNYSIMHNEIYQVTIQNAIKVRAPGTITGNILYDITSYAIAYMNTKPETHQSFILQNNMIYNLNKAAIYLSTAYKTDNIIIRFNTIIVSSNHSIIKNINVSNSIAIYGNILLNSDSDLSISHSNSGQMLLNCNLDSNHFDIEDIGFIMYSEKIDSSQIDLHISDSGVTYGYCTGYNFSLPIYDIDGDIRGENNRIDIGADRIATKELNIKRGLQSGEWLFIAIVFAVFFICIIFVIISAYHKHKRMQKTYKNATTLVRPRTEKQTNKIMKMMIGGKGNKTSDANNNNDNNNNNESTEMEAETNTDAQSEFKVDKGSIKDLRKTDTTNIDNEESNK